MPFSFPTVTEALFLTECSWQKGLSLYLFLCLLLSWRFNTCIQERLMKKQPKEPDSKSLRIEG